MNSEPSESMRRALRNEKASFRIAVSWAMVGIVFWGGGFLLGRWKARALMAAGQWRDHYGEAFIYPVVGSLVGLVGAAGMLGFLIRWLLAIRDRRRLARIESGPQLPFRTP
ncbi:MAG: hypothetical protein JWO82_108 [Akkermansiaceae bacterium]|nr:hypothetical protein [Akkermansiaceae bacterium]